MSTVFLQFFAKKCRLPDGIREAAEKQRRYKRPWPNQAAAFFCSRNSWGAAL